MNHRLKSHYNEDAFKVLVDGDYIYGIISDGAGSSSLAREAAQCVVKSVSRFCFRKGRMFFEGNIEKIAREMVFFIQSALHQEAKKYNAKLIDMMATLIILCIDQSSMSYITVHIGDGIIAKKSMNDKIKVLSFPENGVTRNHTFMINSPVALKHLRTSKGEFVKNDMFFICTDGCYEDCYTTNQYVEKVNNLMGDDTHTDIDFIDDATYIIIEPN